MTCQGKQFILTPFSQRQEAQDQMAPSCMGLMQGEREAAVNRAGVTEDPSLPVIQSLELHRASDFRAIDNVLDTDWENA